MQAKSSRNQTNDYFKTVKIMSKEIIQNEIGNIIYDPSNKECFCKLAITQGGYYAFIQALDIGHVHARLKKPQRLRYWGAYNMHNPKQSIIEIMETGSPWPELPKKQ